MRMPNKTGAGPPPAWHLAREALVLIIRFAGQVAQKKNLSNGRKRHFRLLQNETGIQILTYDQLVDWYRNDQRYKKNVLRLRGFQYDFKSMAAGLNHMLSYFSPGQLLLSENEATALATDGFDMEAWRSGELLVVNGKLPMAKYGALFSNLLSQGRERNA